MWITKTPLRISFAGGGTDRSGYYTENQYGAVCSLAIDKYIYINAKPLPAEFPYRFKLAYTKTELVQHAEHIQHPLLREALKAYNAPSLDFSSMADLPSGTGMGSSSSFSVGLLHALARLNAATPTKESLAHAASTLEIEKCGEDIGKQDQYAAAYGGLNYFQFKASGEVKTQPIILDTKRWQHFHEHMLLLYLGTGERSASSILQAQPTHGRALDLMRKQAATCVSILTGGTPSSLGRLLREAWELKQGLVPAELNSQASTKLQEALQAGAYGGKLLGAGGTGFLLVVGKPEAFPGIIEATGLAPVGFNADWGGSKAYYLGVQ